MKLKTVNLGVVPVIIPAQDNIRNHLLPIQQDAESYSKVWRFAEICIIGATAFATLQELFFSAKNIVVIEVVLAFGGMAAIFLHIIQRQNKQMAKEIAELRDEKNEI